MKSELKLMMAALVATCPEILHLLPEPMQPKQPKLFTHSDEQRLAKAQAKRDRKAMKRAAQAKAQEGAKS